MEKTLERPAQPTITGRTLLAGWLLIIVGLLPIAAFTFVLISAMFTTDFASGANFNLDIYSGLAVLVGTPCLIAVLIGLGKIRLYQHSKA